LPQSEVLDSVSQVAADLGLTLRWTTIEGDPTAIMSLPPLDERGLSYELTRLKLAPGRLLIAGRTIRDGIKRDASERNGSTHDRRDVAQSDDDRASVKKR
jgi:hypothetical protein